MLTIPGHVTVGAVDYRVITDKNVHQRETSGEMYPVTLEIRLSPLLPPDKRESLFIHEVLEAMNVEYSLDLKHRQIELLELALASFLRFNPGVFKQ